jgi:hypothetical protein
MVHTQMATDGVVVAVIVAGAAPDVDRGAGGPPRAARPRSVRQTTEFGMPGE